MTDAAAFRRIALALPGVAEYPHFDRRGFKARVTELSVALEMAWRRGAAKPRTKRGQS